MAICPRTVLRGATVLKVDDKPAGETINISGFGGQGAGWKVNSNGISSPAFPKANVLRLTDDKAREARSAFYEKPVLVAVGDEGFIAAFTYTAELWNDALNTPELRRPPTRALDASIHYVSASGLYDFAVGGSNLTDDRYPTAGSPNTGSGEVGAYFSPPRMWYVSLRARLGQ